MTTKTKLSPEEAARRAAHDQAIAAYNRVNTALGHARSTVDMLEIEVERLAAVCQSFMPQPEPTWVLAKDYDEQPDSEAYGWRKHFPVKDLSCFVEEVRGGKGGFQWSVGGCGNAYIDAEGWAETLEDAKSNAELVALKAPEVSRS